MSDDAARMDVDSSGEGSVTGPLPQHGATSAQRSLGAQDPQHRSRRLSALGHMMGHVPVRSDGGARPSGLMGLNPSVTLGVDSGMPSVPQSHALIGGMIGGSTASTSVAPGLVQPPATSNAPSGFSCTTQLWRARDTALRQRVSKGSRSPSHGVLPACLRTSFQQLQA